MIITAWAWIEGKWLDIRQVAWLPSVAARDVTGNGELLRIATQEVT